METLGPMASEITQTATDILGPSRQTLAPAPSGLATQPKGHWTKIHFGLLLVALVILGVAGQGQHFYYDEWAFLGSTRDALPLPGRYLLPHNEHWSMLPLLAYRTLRATVGVGSYWPYLGLLLLLHLGVTHVLWRLMIIIGSKPIVATALAAVFSVLGAGAENLLWAFQIGFVGSTLLGVGSVCLAATGTSNWRKTGILVVLTVTNLATSGVGLAYLIAVPLVLARRNRRYAAAIFFLPLLVYVAWYAMYGVPVEHATHTSASAPLVVFGFVVFGLAAALTTSSGFPNDLVALVLVGVPILAVLTLACRDWWTQRTPVLRTPSAMSAGALVFFGTVGLSRAGLGLNYAVNTRYVYVTIALLLPAIALVISNGTDVHPRLLRAVVPLAAVMATSNGFQLLTSAAEMRDVNNASRRVLVAAADLVRGSGPTFGDQLPEPHRAADLTTADLRSRHLDTAFDGVIPEPLDRLTASLNLQIRVSPMRGTGTTSTCRNTLEPRITLQTRPATTPAFLVSADSTFVFTLHASESGFAHRVIDLAAGTYKISSLRDAGELTLESMSGGSLLAYC